MSRSRWRSGSIILPNSGGSLQGLIAPAAPMRGGAPEVLLPLRSPEGRALRPSDPGGLSRRGESPQRRARGAPLDPRGGPSEKCFTFSLPLPLRFPHPLDRVSATKIDRFATLGWWANRSLFLLKLHRGHTLNCQSVARQVGFLEDAAGLFTLNQYR